MKKKFIFLTMMLLTFLGVNVLNAQEQETTITIGPETISGASYMLADNYENKAVFSQQIYTAEEIATAGGYAGTITNIAFRKYDGPNVNRTWSIYLKNIEETEFTSAYNYKVTDKDDLQFSGSFVPTNGEWCVFDISGFSYTGGSILVTVLDNEQSYVGDDMSWSQHEASNKTITGTADLPIDLSKQKSWNAYPAYRFDIQLTFEAAGDDIVPTVPTNLVATTVDHQSINLTWDAAENALSYQVWQGESKIAETGQTEYLVEGLSDGTEYCFTVKSVRYNNNTSNASDESCATTAVLPVPATPANLTATNITHNSVTLTWDAVDYAESYTVSYTGGTKTVTENTCDVTGLTPETNYTFSVTANNIKGSSSAAEVSALTLEYNDPFAGKQFRVKVMQGTYAGYYLDVYNDNGTIGVESKTERNTQIFTIEIAGNQYYLKTADGYYIKCETGSGWWNVHAYNTYDKTPLVFEYTDGEQFYIKDYDKMTGNSQTGDNNDPNNCYFKVEDQKVYCDAPIGKYVSESHRTVLWSLEEVALSAVAAAYNSTIFDDQTTTLSVTAIDGSGNYTYSWTPAEGLNDDTSANPTFTPAATGEHTFTCTVTDTESGSTAEASVTVYVNARPELQLAVSADKELIYNDGETAVLTATVTEGTGYAPYTYSWSHAEDLNDATSANPTFTPTATGEYTLTCTVTDARKNTKTASATIEVKDVSERPLEIVIGSDGTTDEYKMLPLYAYYNRSITQQIYTAGELGGNELNITSISFEVVTETPDERSRNVEVYLMNTDKESFTSTTDMENLTDNDKYYTGQLQFNTIGWIELELTKPFEYTGKNLLICVVNENGNYFNNPPYFRVYKTGVNRSLLYYKDDAPKYDHTNVDENSQNSSSSQYCENNNNVIKLGYEIPVPKPENLVATPAQIHVGETINLTWDEPEDAVSYNIYVDGVLNGTTEELPYELSGLTYNVEPGHTIEVSAVYEDDTESGKSNTVTVQVAGTFNLVLNVMDNESNPIAEAMVTITGYDEFDVQKNYEFTTDENGMLNETLPLPLKESIFSIGVSKAPYVNGNLEVMNNSWGGYVENGSTVERNVELQLTGVNQIDTDKEYYDEDEPITLMWGPVENATYNVYVDEEETPRNAEPLTTTTYTLEAGLQYKEYGHQVYVSAVYTIGESEGYGTQVKVNGYGTVSGKVIYGTNDIKGASIVITGQDEYYKERTFTFTTAEDGTFVGRVVFGDSYTATVSKYGYEEVTIENVVVTSESNALDFGTITLSEVEAPEATINDLVAEINNGNVDVTWDAAYARYNVYRKDAAENYEQLGARTAKTYTDESWATLDNGEYTYGVSAFIEGGVGTIIEEHFEGDSYDAPAGWSWTENWTYQQYLDDASRGRSIISHYWVGVYGGTYYLKPSTPVSTANSTLAFDYLFQDYGYSGTSELAVYYATSSEGPWTNSLFYETSETQTTDTWHSAAIDLSDIEGPIYLAFCHIDNGFGPLYIDNIVVTGPVVTESSIKWATPLTKNDANVFKGTSAWTSATNWSNGVPASGANVFIKGDVTIASDVTVNNMTINGGSVTINEGASLTVEGTLVNKAAANLVINDGAQIFQNNEDVPATFVMNIIKWEDKEVNENAWQFISSPFTNASLFSHATGNYDLFKYKGNEEEWYNHKLHAVEFGSTFEQGVGYLASHETAETIVMTGTLNNKNTHNWNSLNYVYEGEKDVASFNLLGNPFPFNMKWSEVVPTGLVTGYAYLDEDGGYKTALDGEIAVGDAFFVKANSVGAQMSYVAVRGAKAEQSEYINLIASGKAGRDNVIINLAGKQEGFTKMQNFNESIATVYVAEDNTRYGIYNCNSDIEEVVVSFNAKDMGDYTIAAVAEGSFSSVVLVDLFTGIETDLLTSGYTFAAKSGDNAERFVVRFSYSQESAMDSNFVYQSGEDLIIMAEGALQIVDMLGRVVYYSEVATDVTRVNVSNFDNAAYIVRVVNGEGVKTQKVVIY